MAAVKSVTEIGTWLKIFYLPLENLFEYLQVSLCMRLTVPLTLRNSLAKLKGSV